MNPRQFDPPLVAILRGLDPRDAAAVGTALFDAGFRIIEVPLNRPGAIEAIGILARMAPADALVGGGTMLSVADVDAVHGAGGRLMVSPNCAVDVIRRGVELGMFCAPGIATPTEAFAAIGAGAHALKIFPAEMVGTGGVKALKSVLPAGMPVWPVGGITPQSIAGWVAAGATGFGIGGALYAPGAAAAAVGAKAAEYVQAWRRAQAGD